MAMLSRSTTIVLKGAGRRGIPHHLRRQHVLPLLQSAAYQCIYAHTAAAASTITLSKDECRETRRTSSLPSSDSRRTFDQHSRRQQQAYLRCYSRSAFVSESSSNESTTITAPPSSPSTTTTISTTDTPPSTKEYSYPELTADAARHKLGLQDPNVPSWQNPLHHNNPEVQKVFPEDFDSRDEFEAHVLPSPPLATVDNPSAAPSHLVNLAEEIVLLNMLEMSELVNKIADHYGFHEGMLSPDGSVAGSGGGGGDDADDDAAASAAAPEVEKTSWDVKLVSFQDASKIKIIKEVRSLAGLGLKEAKEMVEGAPKMILKQVKTDDAHAIKSKLEELGATIELL